MSIKKNGKILCCILKIHYYKLNKNKNTQLLGLGDFEVQISKHNLRINEV